MNSEIRRRVEANLYPGALPAVEPWDEFPWHIGRDGCDTHRSYASQALSINLFGMFKCLTQTDRDLACGTVAEMVGVSGAGPWTVELEWTDPLNRLNEPPGVQHTQVDALATVSVLDRRGQRLGTVYLGRMPEEGQHTLSGQLTALLQDVLKRWAGPLPRLVYVTDAGNHQTEYYKKILRRMTDPRSPDSHVPGQRLQWEWVLDYYHACEYVSKLAEALFGEGREAQAWAAKMRQWLKHKPKAHLRQCFS